MIPVLQTARLVLRPLEARDFDDFFEYAQDPQVSAPGMWEPYESEAVARQDFDHLLTLYAKGLMWWGMEDKATSKMIGRCELADYRADEAKAELSYALNRDFWGQGYMMEAAQPIIQYGFDRLGLNRIGAQVFVDNAGSIRLLEKLGMMQEGCLRQYRKKQGQPTDVYIYSLLREDQYSSSI